MSFSFATYAVVIPLVCLLGLLGNFLTLVVIGRRSTESVMYGLLASLSVCDIGFLLCNVVECYFLVGQSGRLYSTEAGQRAIWEILHPTLSVLKTSSDLVVIWMTLDRCRTLSKIDKKPLAKERPTKTVWILAQFLVILAVSFFVTTPYYFEYDVIPQGV